MHKISQTAKEVSDVMSAGLASMFGGNKKTPAKEPPLV